MSIILETRFKEILFLQMPFIPQTNIFTRITIVDNILCLNFINLKVLFEMSMQAPHKMETFTYL